MGTLFFWRVIISFVIGGSVIVAVTCIAERLTARWAGVLSAMPTTLVSGMIFITIAQGLPATISALTILPTMIIAIMCFVLGFLYFYPRGAMYGLLGGISLWAIVAFIALHLPRSIWLHFGIFIVGYISIALYVGTFRTTKTVRVCASCLELMIRAVIAGSVISMVVIATRIGGPLWGGLCANFPAAISCTLVLMSRKHGLSFGRSIAKTMPHGSAGSCTFGMVFYVCAPHFSMWTGFGLGLLIGYVAALIVSVSMNVLFKRIHSHPLYVKITETTT